MFGRPIFETACTRENATVLVTPVCYDGTASYGKGTNRGPEIILNAYEQLDYKEPRFNMDRSALGVFVDEPTAFQLGADENVVGELIRAEIHRRTLGALRRGQIPALLGGEHSVSLGAIQAVAQQSGELGVLQIDAHMDLRKAYEGYTYSHASVMRNVIDSCPEVTRLVQVGIRDYCEEEQDVVESADGRIVVLRDHMIFEATDAGRSFKDLCIESVSMLPDNVYITFDIDGLDPALCPGTGTPVPGGLSFNQAVMLLQVVAESCKRVVGFDLVEVAPSPDGSEWDANVGARVLYRLCLCAAVSQVISSEDTRNGRNAKRRD
ncbi:MAG: agmatinase [Leptolyngbya sp. SIO3F4]|nr:agmatinase [Leptolyngbya sp. SIO3F4]